MHEDAKETLGARFRRHRIQQGLTTTLVANTTGVQRHTLGHWEAGRHAPLPWNLPKLAKSLGIPVSALFDDEAHIADITLSGGTLEEIRKGGRETSKATAERLASLLEPLIWQAATMPAVDTRPGARAARKRRTRREVLAGSRAAKKATAAARARRNTDIA